MGPAANGTDFGRKQKSGLDFDRTGNGPQMSDTHESTTPEATSATKPTSVRELVKAWKRSDLKVTRLESRLQETAKSAQRYRRDLLLLVRQNQLRKQQSDHLRHHLLTVLERQSPPTQTEAPLEIPQDAEPVPAAAVVKLLERLRDSQKLVEEYQTLLKFRENQVQELLAHSPAASQASPIREDFVQSQLRQRLSEARHRIRLLTKELAAAQELAPPKAETPAEVELTAQLHKREQQLRDLATQVQPLQEAVKKLQAALTDSLQKQKELEAKVSTSGGSSESEDLFQEVLTLQEEIGRLQDENLRLSDQAQEGLSLVEERNAFQQQISALQGQLASSLTANSGGPDGQVVAQLQAKIAEQEEQLGAALHQLQGQVAQLSELEQLRAEIAQLRQTSKPDASQQAEIARLASELQAARTALAGAGVGRNEKLEAAVIELKSKLQLAASKYQEVKQAVIDKHKELGEAKAANQLLESRNAGLEPAVRTLEAALSEARQEAERLKRELEARKNQPAAATGAPVDTSGLEEKLKEARRSAVRAQAEAGMKRKEAAKLQEELDAALAKLKAHGIS